MASHCPNCGSAFLPDALFCRKCGTKRPQAKSWSREAAEVTTVVLLFWLLQIVPCSDENRKKGALKAGYWKMLTFVSYGKLTPLDSLDFVRRSEAAGKVGRLVWKNSTRNPTVGTTHRWQVRTSQRSWQIGVPLAPEMNLLWCCGFVNSLRLVFVGEKASNVGV